MQAHHGQPRCSRDVYRASEKVLQGALQGGLLERARRLRKLDENIEIAVGACLARATDPNIHTFGAP